MRIHEAAKLLLNTTDAEFDELRINIKANSLLCPIELVNGPIIDGRHRYMACQKLKIEPESLMSS